MKLLNICLSVIIVTNVYSQKMGLSEFVNIVEFSIKCNSNIPVRYDQIFDRRLKYGLLLIDTIGEIHLFDRIADEIDTSYYHSTGSISLSRKHDIVKFFGFYSAYKEDIREIVITDVSNVPKYSYIINDIEILSYSTYSIVNNIILEKVYFAIENKNIEDIFLSDIKPNMVKTDDQPMYIIKYQNIDEFFTRLCKNW